jgi:SAM-dependent methyltransferase
MSSRQELGRFVDVYKPVLEIGPLNSPAVQIKGVKVYYADIRSTEDVTEVYRNEPGVYAKNATPIDFVVKTTYKEAVGDMRFQTVFSSHVIEHTFDFIKHLQEIGEILNEGGHYIMCVPDKRHCFDHFREVTPFRDAYDVYVNGENALRRLKMDYFMMRHPCNNPAMYLSEDVSFSAELFSEERYTAAQNRFHDFAKDSDVAHFWVFTRLSFLAMIRDCLLFNLIPFEVIFEQDSTLTPVEFFIVLKKTSAITSDGAKRRNEIFRLNEIIEKDKSENKKFGLHLKGLKGYVSSGESVYICGKTENIRYLLHILGEDAKYISGATATNGYEAENCGVPVYNMNEITDKNSKIIMAVPEEDKNDVLQRLKDAGFANIATYLPLSF